MTTEKKDLVHLAKPLAASAVAPGECVSVPDAAIEWIDQWDCKNSVTIGEATVFLKRFFDDWPGGFDEIESSINGWRQRAIDAQAGMQPPNNQPNADHVAVIGAEPEPRVRGSHIKGTLDHDAGAYACCSYCGRYSDNLGAIRKSHFMCDCGRDAGWSGSFKRPTEKSTWSGPESGISSPTKEQGK